MCLVFQILLVLQIPWIPGRCVANINSTIIRGEIAKRGQFPTLVSLRHVRSGSHRCGGNILSRRWILTAAHCVVENAQVMSNRKLVVVAGDIELKTLGSVSQLRYIQKFIVHPGYSYSMYGYTCDLALIKLKKNLRFNMYVKPVALRNDAVKPGTVCTVAGWGSYEQYAGASYWLRYARVPIIDKNVCQRWRGHKLPADNICAGPTQGGIDACSGDSGGGLVCDGVLTGLVSWGGFECAAPYDPTKYIDVYYHLDWTKCISCASRKSVNLLIYCLFYSMLS